MSALPNRTRDFTTVALFCAVLSLCLLFYAGRTFVIDDFTLLASAANLGSAGRSDINELAYSHWDLPPPSSLGAFGPTGDYFAKKAPAPAWLAAPLYRLGMLVPWLGNGATAFLLSPLLTAATAVLVYDLARRMGYARGAALAGGLLYGGASMALVYSRYLLGEPVMAFGLTAAAWGAWMARNEGRSTVGAVICGLGLGLAAGGNLAMVLLAPVFGVYLALLSLPLPKQEPGKSVTVRERLSLLARAGRGMRGVTNLLWFGSAFGACLALIGAYNLARFGAVLESGYHFGAGEGFTAPLGLGLYGLILSPARGLLWFNPLSWLALPGWLLWRRRRPAEAWLSLAVVVALLLIFGAWWAWAGGVSWGPRFLLPAVPFLTLATLPILAQARARRAWTVPVALVIAAAVLVQITGAAADINIYEGELNALDPRGADGPAGYSHGWRALTDPALSPIIGNARLLLERGPGVAWHQAGGVDWVAVGVLALALVVSLAGTVICGRSTAHCIPAVGIAVIVFLAANVALSRLPTPVTGASGAPLQELPAALAAREPGDVLLTLTPDLTWALLELTDRPPAVGLPRGAWREDAQANVLFARALDGKRRAWLLTYDPPPASWYEDRLREAGQLVDERTLDGYRLARYMLARE